MYIFRCLPPLQQGVGIPGLVVVFCFLCTDRLYVDGCLASYLVVSNHLTWDVHGGASPCPFIVSSFFIQSDSAPCAGLALFLTLAKCDLHGRTV